MPLMALINPEITPVGRESVEDWEGCLSIPDIRGRVPRAREIVVRAYDRTGKRIEMRVSGFTARVIQHETDHLDGMLFFDRMKSFESLTFLDEFGRYWSHREVTSRHGNPPIRHLRIRQSTVAISIANRSRSSCLSEPSRSSSTAE